MSAKQHIPVEMDVRIDIAGRSFPTALYWEGKRYPIKKILDVKKGSELKHREIGTRYIVQVGRKRYTLFAIDQDMRINNLPRTIWKIEKEIPEEREHAKSGYRHPHSPDYY